MILYLILQIDNRTPNYGCGISEDTKEIHNCLVSPDANDKQCDERYSVSTRNKILGPMLHSVQAKKISLLTPSESENHSLKPCHAIIKESEEAVL